MTIRRSTLDHGTRVVEIWHVAVDATHKFLAPKDRVEIEQSVRNFLPRIPVWLAVDPSDKPIGFTQLTKAHIEALFVDPEYHGRGVGRALVKHALTLQPSLTTDVNEQNAGAVSF